MQLKRIVNISANLILILPLIMVLSSVFIVSKDLANGVVAGKYFWFYLSIGLISITTPLSLIINRKNITFSIIDLLILAFCISAFAVTFYHNNTVSNRSVLLLLVSVLYFYFKVALAQYKWGVFILTAFFMLTGLVEAIWGLRQLYDLTPSQHNLFKTTGSFFNPGPYAGYLAIVMPLVFYYMLNDYRIFKHKIHSVYIPFYIRWAIAAFSFISITLVLPATMSRASWIATAIGCLIATLFYSLKSKNLQKYIKHFGKKQILSLSVLLILLTVCLAGAYYLKKDSADGRTLIWKTSIQAIKENPFGVGLGSFPGVYGDKQTQYFLEEKGSEREQLIAGNPEYAFNEYLQICIELGIIPFFVFISICIYTVYAGIKRKKYAAIGAFVSLLIFALMSYPFSILPFLISFVFLISLSCSNYSDIRRGISKNIALIMILFLITNVLLYNRYPTHDAYKKWNKAQILYRINQHKDAAVEYKNLYPLLNHEVQFLFEYAQSLSKSEQYEESNKVLEKAVKISCDPMLYSVMGKNHQALENYTLAEQYFIKAAMIVPSRLYPYYLLAKLYDEMGDREKVCKMAELIQLKEAKVHSMAVNEMREELKSICEKYKNK